MKQRSKSCIKATKPTKQPHPSMIHFHRRIKNIKVAESRYWIFRKNCLRQEIRFSCIKLRILCYNTKRRRGVFTPREFSILFDLHAAISCHQKFRVWYYFFTLPLFSSFTTSQWKLEESAVQVLIRPGNCNFKVVHFIFRACSFFYSALLYLFVTSMTMCKLQLLVLLLIWPLFKSKAFSLFCGLPWPFIFKSTYMPTA